MFAATAVYARDQESSLWISRLDKGVLAYLPNYKLEVQGSMEHSLKDYKGVLSHSLFFKRSLIL